MTEYITMDQLNKAYFDCRRHKRTKMSALRYEMNYEIYNYQLWKDINEGTYQIQKSTVFCVTIPKVREVFAAQFRDRIIHHLIMNKTAKIFESEFIQDTYSCLPKRGVLYGVKRIQEQINEIGKDCWYAKLDISGFFTQINKDILFDKIEKILRKRWDYTDTSIGNNIDWWLALIRTVVFNRPDLNCEKHGNLKLFDMVPENRSLFKSDGRGLPIGNLTSQYFANIYMNDLDHAVLQNRDILGYGRYVDDIILLGNSRDIKYQIPFIREEVKKLDIQLNEKKTVIQRADKGLLFTGYIIQPYGLYLGPQLWSNMLHASHRSHVTNQRMITSINSYFGFACHTHSYGLKHKILDNIKRHYPNIDQYNNYQCLKVYPYIPPENDFND